MCHICTYIVSILGRKRYSAAFCAKHEALAAKFVRPHVKSSTFIGKDQELSKTRVELPTKYRADKTEAAVRGNSVCPAGVRKSLFGNLAHGNVKEQSASQVVKFDIFGDLSTNELDSIWRLCEADRSFITIWLCFYMSLARTPSSTIPCRSCSFVRILYHHCVRT